ncbi:uncharacterized protein [Argopecten irradians]|uniref:uncharacterized protein n=1 Tax=Argopecten irradians TaxID=31199 RepID=UPI0037135B30
MLNFSTEKYVGYWIGVTDEVTEGVFRTYDGRIQNYTNWKSGDPNDNNMPAQDCARIFPMETPGYLWQDRSCTETAPGLCSRQFHATSNGDTTTIMASRSTIEVVTSEDLSTGWREPIGNQGMTTDQDLGTDQGVTSNPEKTSDPETDSVVQNESTEMTSVATVEMTSSFNRQSSLETTESDSACSVCSSSEPNTTCYCTCSPYLTLDDPLVKEKINELIETLSISKKNTSANRRKYISVADNRPSARGIGYIGAAILVVSLGSIILLDLSTFLRHVKHLTMKATGREKENTDWATRNPT